MAHWEYDISTHTAEEVVRVREAQGHPADPAGPTIVYCDTEAQCFFDEAPNPYVEAIVHILNEKGKEGWGLVQMAFRERDFVCVWRREA